MKKIVSIFVLVLWTGSALANVEPEMRTLSLTNVYQYHAKKPWESKSGSKPSMDTRPWSLAGGVDVLHSRGSPYLELRYSGQRWKHWSAYLGTTVPQGEDTGPISPRMGVELYDTWFSGRLITGLGLTLAEADDIVGTPFRYQLRFGWLFKLGWGLELVHESNCRSVCGNSLLRWMIPTGASQGYNRGYNFLVIRTRL